MHPAGDDWANILTEDGPLPGTADTKRVRYDAMNRVVGVVTPDPDGASPLPHRAERTVYDAAGRVMKVEKGTVGSQSDAAWAAFTSVESVEYQRDAVGRVTGAAVKGGSTTYAVTHVSYDGAWRPECTARRMNPAQWATQTSACTAQAAGPNGPDRIQKNFYDLGGQLIKVQDALGTADQIDKVTYTYTSNGKRSSLTDAEHNTSTFHYDGFDRLYQTRYPVTTQGAQQSSTSNFEQTTYDNNDNITLHRLRDGQVIGYTYDALDRQTLKDLPAPELDVSTAHDLQARIVSVTQGSSTIVRDYDALGFMWRETSDLGPTSYIFDSAGRRTRTTWPDGFYVTYDHFTTGEVTAIRENGAQSGIGVLALYGYDSMGRKLSVTAGNGTVSSFGYDGVSRLTSRTHDLAATVSDIASTFAYSPVSQVTSSTRNNDAYAWTANYNVSRNYTINGLNQITQSVSGSNTLAFQHDGRGNLTNYGPSVYGYSVENRLKTASNGATLWYDPSGRLSRSSGLGGTTRFQYDGTDLAAEFNASGQLLRRYVHGPGADEPLVWYEGSGTGNRRWLHHDERGSVISVSDATGVAIAVNSYDEYGIPAAGNLGRFQYTGQTWLPELAMYYYKARLYSPALGRFLQTDPIGYSDELNLYMYAANDPVVRIDPSGLVDLDYFHRPAKSENDRKLIAAFGSFDIPNTFTIAGHANPNYSYRDDRVPTVNPNWRNHQGLLSDMKAAGFQQGETVFHFGCHIGAYHARITAALTGSVVYAANGFVIARSTQDSFIITAWSRWSPDKGVGGERVPFEKFLPNGRVSTAADWIKVDKSSGEATLVREPETGSRIRRITTVCSDPEVCKKEE